VARGARAVAGRRERDATVDVVDSFVSSVECGGGTAFVLLHGNPGSSHVWRKVLPGIGDGWCLLAPDLIGMGRSGKPDLGYSFADHARYVDAWFDTLALDRVVLVGHDWGGALAFGWAARHQAIRVTTDSGRQRRLAYSSLGFRGSAEGNATSRSPWHDTRDLANQDPRGSGHPSGISGSGRR